ncbi:MAG: SIMPL domain-containing protein [Candidatus Niyogibacteria bacterium]|nr:SIMPL domain-containing protein [Candidatus Niyogibacteria bacterium]
MDKKIKNYLGIAVISGIALLAISSFWYVDSFSKSITLSRTFSANGEGKVAAVPDVAQLSFGVLTEGGKNLTNLQKENTDKLNKAIAFLKENGIEEKDIKTQFYDIAPRYKYFSCPPLSGESAVSCPPSEIVGYTINQSVLVKIRELNKAGDVVAGVVNNGANTVSGLSFTVDDQTELQNQARAKAIAEAKRKARAIAEAGGFRLGKLISINENGSFPLSMPYALEFGGKGGSEDFRSAALEPGSQEIRVSVTLIYEIR